MMIDDSIPLFKDSRHTPIPFPYLAVNGIESLYHAGEVNEPPV